MYDDRVFDVIMEEMMSSFGSDVRTDEGSLIYNACAKIAEKLEEIYGDMDELNDNMLPDTQDETHLIEYGRERGLDYTYATAPIVRGVFSQGIEIGERFSCNDYTYEVIEHLSDFDYKMICETEGTEANANFGSLEPLDYVDDYQGGEITEIIVAGVDDEDIEEFREKVIETFRVEAFGGNKADYRRFINDIAGVGGCKPMRRAADSPWINIHVIGSDYNVPSSQLIEEVQTAVDPGENSGEGEGMAPICHHVKVYPCGSVTINVSTKITFATGYSVDTSRSAIENAVKEYLQSLRAGWESTETEPLMVRISQIESKILTVDGVIDVNNTKINNSTNNLPVDYTKIPLYGEVVINV